MNDKVPDTIPKKDLVHGEYYEGVCRNAGVARWDATTDVFVYRRQKFGTTFLEEIKHPEDDQVWDVFHPLKHMTNPVETISLTERRP